MVIRALLAFALVWLVVAGSVLPSELHGPLAFATVLVVGCVWFAALQDRAARRRSPPREVQLSPRSRSLRGRR